MLDLQLYIIELQRILRVNVAAPRYFVAPGAAWRQVHATPRASLLHFFVESFKSVLRTRLKQKKNLRKAISQKRYKRRHNQAPANICSLPNLVTKIYLSLMAYTPNVPF